VANHAELNPEKALIWRIVHRDNLPWILDHGLHCGNSTIKAPNWVSIGNPDLTQDRETRIVPLAPGGNLNDYVPFYFTPFSVMMRNIQTGWGGIRKRPNEEILILVSSLRHVQALGLPFLFTDAHAYYRYTTFYSGLADLDKIDWPSLQAQDFRRDPDNPMKFERYQAEALIHQHLPVAGLLGIVCYTPALQESFSAEIVSRSLKLKAIARTGLYIR
jgi:hypothetical protein